MPAAMPCKTRGRDLADESTRKRLEGTPHNGHDESHIHAEKHGVVSEIEERTEITMSWTSIQGMEMGAGWVKVAQDRAVWWAKMDAMIKWRKQKMADRKCSSIE